MLGKDGGPVTVAVQAKVAAWASKEDKRRRERASFSGSPTPTLALCASAVAAFVCMTKEWHGWRQHRPTEGDVQPTWDAQDKRRGEEEEEGGEDIGKNTQKSK